MPEIKIKTRPVGSSATLGRNGHPALTTPTGGALDIVTGASEPGFNPIDLLCSSLSACLVLSARIAASQLGLLDRFQQASAHVTMEKAKDEPSRVARFIVEMEIAGDFDDQTRHRIAELAEDICTVSNTLKNPPEISLKISGE